MKNPDETFRLEDLSVMTPREATVTILAHGLDGGVERPVGDTSAFLGLSTHQVTRSLRRGQKRLFGILPPKGNETTAAIIADAVAVAAKRADVLPCAFVRGGQAVSVKANTGSERNRLDEIVEEEIARQNETPKHIYWGERDIAVAESIAWAAFRHGVEMALYVKKTDVELYSPRNTGFSGR